MKSKGLLVFVCAVTVLWGAANEPGFSHNPISTTVLFNREVMQVLNAKCAQCHAAESMAMSLQTYEEARPWAVAIKEEILRRRMPPWPAEPGYGTFLNDTSLTAREQAFLISWADGGAPSGEGAPPAYMDHSAHWMLGAPDHVYAGSLLGGDGARPGFRRFVVKTTLPADAWIRAIDFKPGDKYARAAFLRIAATGEYIGGWSRAYPTLDFPQQVGFLLPRTASITVDVLYGPTVPGTADAPRLGVYQAREALQPITTAVLRVRGGQSEYVTGRLRLEQSATVFSLWPEMARPVRALEARAIRPDGSYEPLLLIRSVDDAWQTPFVLRSPVTLVAGTTIEAIVRFDETLEPADLVLHVQTYAPSQAAALPPAPHQH